MFLNILMRYKAKSEKSPISCSSSILLLPNYQPLLYICTVLNLLFFKKVLWLNVLGYTKRLPHDVI